MAHHHHVCRIDSDAKRYHCWRVQVRCNNHIVIQSFSDGRYGGKRKALQAALVWRDARLSEIEYERKQRWLRNCTALRRNNSSGIVGVGRYISRNIVGDMVVERAYWHATWQDKDGQRHCRKFSVNKLGEERAKALACAVRQLGMAELIAVHQ